MKQRLPKSLTAPLCAFAAFITLTAVAAAQPHGFVVLHSFHGSDGAQPSAPLAIDKDGNLYSTTANGGDLNCSSPQGCGVVFKLNALTGSYSLLHVFTGSPDGQNPEAGVIRDAAGTLYGTTDAGGNGCSPGSCGSVYQVTAGGQEQVLYSFTGGPSDGAGPVGSLFKDAGGNLFGTTGSGGVQGVFGSAFEVKPTGAETVLHLFQQSPDGAAPETGFVADSAGNLYSTTALGGSANSNCMGVGCGTIFELSPNGSGGWNESVVYSFQGGSDGLQPNGNLVEDASGNFYGVTAGGGSNTNCGTFGCGTIFKLTRTSSGWTESVLYNFTGGNDGGNPRSMVRDSHGNLYGGATSSGKDHDGTLFEFTADGKFKTLHTFTGTDGQQPLVGLLIEQPTTVIFGAASGGDPSCQFIGCGVVFAYAP